MEDLAWIVKEMGEKPILIDISNVINWWLFDDEKENYDIADSNDYPTIMNPFRFALWKTKYRGSDDMCYILSKTHKQSKRVYRTEYMIFYHRFDIRCLFSHVTIECDEYGKYIEGEGLLVNVYDSPLAREIVKEIGFEKMKEFAHDFIELRGLLFAINLLHCKNVELVDEPISRQYKRTLERKGRFEQWKVLDIFPMQKQIRNQNNEHGESEIRRALHICRGHFRTYSDDRPLFGKVTGTFWIPQHLRGDSNIGIIHKDYREHKPINDHPTN